MIYFKLLIETVLEVWGVASLASFVAYKRHSYGAVRWEDGFYVLAMRMVSLGSKLMPTLKKKLNIWWADNTIRYEHGLDNKEVLALVKQFEGHPYETPSLLNYNVDIIENSVIRIDISAVGLSSKYKHITNDEIRNIAHNIIQNFYMETRNTRIDVYIHIATPERLYFEIPLSCRGRKIIEQTSTSVSEKNDSKNTDVIEETIDLFEDIGRDIK